MKRTYVAGLLLILAAMINLSGCGKEKCGCEAETRFNVDAEPGELYMESKDYAYINSVLIQGRFTLCNPDRIPAEIRELAMERYNHDNPDLSEPVAVYFTGEAKDDCIKLYYQWYYYYYELVLSDIEKAE